MYAMKNLKGIILIFFAIFSITVLQAFSVNAENLALKNVPFKVTKEVNILSPSTYENDIISAKDLSASFCALKNSSNSIVSKKGNNNNLSGNSDCAIFVNEQFGALLDYLYSKSYLETQSKSVISLLEYQIQPNAP